MSTEAIETPDTQAIERDLAPVVARASGLVIADKAGHEAGQLYLTEIVARERFVKEQFEEPKRKAFEAHRSITALEKRILEPLLSARALVSRKLTAYEDTERQRAEAERRRREEEARRKEEERRLMDLAATEDPEEAAEIEAEPIVAPVIEVATETAKVEGVSTAVRYKAEVTDLLALVRHVAATPEHVNLLQVNGPALNALARSLREALSIPGVRVVKERDMRVRREVR